MSATPQNVDIPEVETWRLLSERSLRPCRDDKSKVFGQGLRSVWSWQTSDTLAILSPNDIDYAAVVFGCFWAAGIVTTVSPTYTQNELASQFRDSGAKATINMLPLAEVAFKAAREAGIPESRVILLGENATDSRLLHFQSLGDTFKAKNTSRPFLINPRSDLAFLVNIVSNILMISAGQEGTLSCGNGQTGSGDKTIGFVPFFHIYGLTGILNLSVYRGYEVLVTAASDIEVFCSTVQRYSITSISVIPRVILALAKHPIVDEYDLSSIRMMISAAAPLSKDLTLTVYPPLKIPVVQACDQSETSPSTHYMKREEWEQAMDSIGRLLPNQECKIVSVEGGQEVSVDEIGEFWLRGPNTFQGYLNNAAATPSLQVDDIEAEMSDMLTKMDCNALLAG